MSATAPILAAEAVMPVAAANDTVYPTGARLKRTVDFAPTLARLHAASLKAAKASGVVAGEVAQRALQMTRTLWKWLCQLIARIFSRAGQRAEGLGDQETDQGQGANQVNALTDQQLQGEAPVPASVDSEPGKEGQQEVALQAVALEAEALAQMADRYGPDLMMLQDESKGPDYLDGVVRQMAAVANRYDAQSKALRDQALDMVAQVARAQGVTPEVVQALIMSNRDAGLLDRQNEIRTILAQADAAQVAAERTRASAAGLLKVAASIERLAPKAQLLASELLQGLDVMAEPLASPVTSAMIGAKASGRTDSVAIQQPSGVSADDHAGAPHLENVTAVMYDTKNKADIAADAGHASPEDQQVAERDEVRSQGDDFPYAPRVTLAALAKQNPIDQDDRPDAPRDRF